MYSFVNTTVEHGTHQGGHLLATAAFFLYFSPSSERITSTFHVTIWIKSPHGQHTIKDRCQNRSITFVKYRGSIVWVERSFFIEFSRIFDKCIRVSDERLASCAPCRTSTCAILKLDPLENCHLNVAIFFLNEHFWQLKKKIKF